MKQTGYKVVKIYVENEAPLYDIAIFGHNSLIVDNIQLCEDLCKKVTIETKEQIEETVNSYISVVRPGVVLAESNAGKIEIYL